MTLMTGTALGQGLALLLSPIIFRLFDPYDVSSFEQYAFLLSVLSVIVTGRYEFAIMHTADREEARHVAGLSLRLAWKLCLLIFIILVLSSGRIAEFYGNPGIQYWLWTLPVALFAAAIFNVVTMWFSREKNYRVAATSRLLYSACGEPVKVVAGAINPSIGGLVLGTVLGNVATAVYAWNRFRKNVAEGLRGLSLSRMTSLARKHSDYPVYTMAGSVLNNLAQWAHVAVFTFFYGTKAIIPIAFIALSRRIFFNPLGILSSSYGQVFYQRISEITDAIELRKFFMKNLFRFLGFAACMVLIVHLLPDNTLGRIFGENWTGAMVYLRILSFWYALNFVISTLSFIFYRLNLQWYTLAVDIFHFLIVIIAFWIAWQTGMDELGAVKAMVWAKVIYLVINGAAVIYFLNRNTRNSQLEN